MTLLRLLFLTLMVAMVGGCQCGFMAKRASECHCPTDIRQTLPWTVGEDAVFRCPCGPSSNYYGYKPTCWSSWPTSGATWREERCGPLLSEGESGSAFVQDSLYLPLEPYSTDNGYDGTWEQSSKPRGQDEADEPFKPKPNGRSQRGPVRNEPTPLGEELPPLPHEILQK